MDAYQEDLAHIHESGFAGLAESAAFALVEYLSTSRDSDGLVAT